MNVCLILIISPLCIAESLPAAIQYQVVGGSWVRGRGGERWVTRGAGLSLDCVFR